MGFELSLVFFVDVGKDVMPEKVIYARLYITLKKN